MVESTDPTVTYAGWVFKEGSLVKNWKKRFLVVKRRELAYYKTTDHTSRHAQLMGSMRVARVDKAGGITNGLIISSMEGRQLKIFMDTANERDRCYEAIVEWCQPAGAGAGGGGGGGRASLTGSAPSTATGRHSGSLTITDTMAAASRNSDLGARNSITPRMAGWLEKQGQNMPTWKRRYFVLDEGILTYSTDEGTAALGRHRVLGVRRDRTKPFTLGLTLDTGRELRVSALDEHNLGEWQRALRQTLEMNPMNRNSEHANERPSGEDLRGRLTADDPSQASYNNLFGAPPLADADESASPRLNSDVSFGCNIRLDFDGQNTSFIECEDPRAQANVPPPPKPFSPTAPGVNTIRKMRIEQHLLDEDEDDDIVITRVSSTQPASSNSGSSSPVPSRRPPTFKPNEPVPAGPCCCVVM